MGVGGGPCLGTAGVGAKKWVVQGGCVALEKSVVVTSVGLTSSSSCWYFVVAVSIIIVGGTVAVVGRKLDTK